MEERIDKILLERGLVSTRVRAEEIIKNYGVKVNGKLFSKPGKKVPTDAKLNY
jgi:23S rRNA (cytidine1920-2'-O)/16S rRNA (cytidine1409-2'-O)-methyltransferase